MRVRPLSTRPGATSSNRGGATTVEFALVVPVFFVMFFGMVDISRGFMVQSLLDNAARMGCRTAILQGKSNSDVQTAVSSALQGQGINGTTVTITVNGNSTDVSAAATGDTVQVSVSVPVANITWLPGAAYVKGTITGTRTQPHS